MPTPASEPPASLPRLSTKQTARTRPAKATLLLLLLVLLQLPLPQTMSRQVDTQLSTAPAPTAAVTLMVRNSPMPLQLSLPLPMALPSPLSTPSPLCPATSWSMASQPMLTLEGERFLAHRNAKDRGVSRTFFFYPFLRVPQWEKERSDLSGTLMSGHLKSRVHQAPISPYTSFGLHVDGKHDAAHTTKHTK
ncbi:uncharacterized protein B0I36DRAFT_327681 [Microdochium trichocladiopsis]|uniref:Uncharacterized protein n=1 Tax=Microdochium trichocladiopsis TaxID=1682393 RepID=A0A9P8Y1Y4_9PEZI|nr:uncharacterized protein B0I36DRAFT_327681 [Microdochium trichocladiopsis]KAH7027705.1 hypothetical protein B0I36DRAFT_327681 [Microdochium trichocladiopsis]